MYRYSQIFYYYDWYRIINSSDLFHHLTISNTLRMKNGAFHWQTLMVNRKKKEKQMYILKWLFTSSLCIAFYAEINSLQREQTQSYSIVQENGVPVFLTGQATPIQNVTVLNRFTRKQKNFFKAVSFVHQTVNSPFSDAAFKAKKQSLQILTLVNAWGPAKIVVHLQTVAFTPQVVQLWW